MRLLARPLYVVAAAAACLLAVPELSAGSEVARTGAPAVRADTSVTWVEVAAGGEHACGITESGQTACWGTSVGGALGHGPNFHPVVPSGGAVDPPVPVAGDHEFASLTLGSSFSCALTSDGRAYCWGQDDGQFGNGTNIDREVPVPAGGSKTWTELVAGDTHTCGITEAGETYCWGDNGSGQLGNDDWQLEITNVTVEPAKVAGGHGFVRLAAGTNHTCGLTGDGTAYCWGDNEYGQLGNGRPDGRDSFSTTPVRVSGEHTFRSLDAGVYHTCGRTEGGEVYCWGRKDMVGRARAPEAVVPDVGVLPRPTPVDLPAPARALEVGDYHSCALLEDGPAHCWGDNGSGALGDGTTEPRVGPVKVETDVTFREIDAGTDRTCGINPDGDLYCWPGGPRSPSGTPLEPVPHPVPVPPPAAVDDDNHAPGAKIVSPERDQWSSGPDTTIHEGDTLRPVGVAGDREEGDLRGDALTWVSDVDGPVGTGQQPSVVLTAGATHALSLVAADGQGRVDTARREVAVESIGDVRWSRVSAGTSHTCGLAENGRVYCWGDNGSGELGDGTTEDRPTPVEAPTRSREDTTGRAVAMAAGGLHSCAVRQEGTALCWGADTSNQLGRPTRNDGQARITPQPTPGFVLFEGASDLERFSVNELTRMTTGEDHVCVLDGRGRAFCWGANRDGRIDPGIEDRTLQLPVRVRSETTFDDLAAGETFTCGIEVSGELSCWGTGAPVASGSGEVVPLETDRSFRRVAAGSHHACALTEQGAPAIYCWGRGPNGELGVPPSEASTTPVPVRGLDPTALSGARDLTVGDRHGCVLNGSGEVFCWGDNSQGQIGAGDTQGGHRPVRVKTDRRFVDIDAGHEHTCGTTADGELLCWGANDDGQLGDASTSRQLTPVEVLPPYSSP